MGRGREEEEEEEEEEKEEEEGGTKKGKELCMILYGNYDFVWKSYGY